eukprot:15479570-Alexandrium_andersonii.AAC.2
MRRVPRLRSAQRWHEQRGHSPRAMIKRARRAKGSAISAQHSFRMREGSKSGPVALSTRRSRKCTSNAQREEPASACTAHLLCGRRSAGEAGFEIFESYSREVLHHRFDPLESRRSCSRVLATCRWKA